MQIQFRDRAERIPGPWLKLFLFLPSQLKKGPLISLCSLSLVCLCQARVSFRSGVSYQHSTIVPGPIVANHKSLCKFKGPLGPQYTKNSSCYIVHYTVNYLLHIKSQSVLTPAVLWARLFMTTPATIPLQMPFYEAVIGRFTRPITAWANFPAWIASWHWPELWDKEGKLHGICIVNLHESRNIIEYL